MTSLPLVRVSNGVSSPLVFLRQNLSLQINLPFVVHLVPKSKLRIKENESEENPKKKIMLFLRLFFEGIKEKRREV